MEQKIQYTFQDVQNKLGLKIANLEIHLANEQAAKEAAIKHAKELEKKVAELEKKVKELENQSKKESDEK